MYLPRGRVWRQFVPLVVLTVVVLTIAWSTRDKLSANVVLLQEKHDSSVHNSIHDLQGWERKLLNTRRLAQILPVPNSQPRSVFHGRNHVKHPDAYIFNRTRAVVVDGASPQVDAEIAEIRALNGTKMAQQAQIRQQIQKVCKEMKPSSSLSKWERDYLLKHLIVDDKYQLLYCYVPKVGCANWKRVFNALYGDVTKSDDVVKVDHTSMYLLSTYTEQEVEYRLQNYFKFMFVRHPLDRLLSAYRNKFGEHFVDFEEKYGVYIVKNFRPNPPRTPKGDDVTFPEFLNYVASTRREKLNEHWSAYVDLCQPCHVTYDFVGYYEEFDEDVNFLLEALKLDEIVHYPKKQGYYKALSVEEVLQYVHQIPNSTLNKLTRRLVADYRLFAYPMDKIDGPNFNQ